MKRTCWQGLIVVNLSLKFLDLKFKLYWFKCVFISNKLKIQRNKTQILYKNLNASNKNF